MIDWDNLDFSGTTPIAMQPRHFRRIRRVIWTLRCFMEYRSILNAEAWLKGAEPWPWSVIWKLTKATAQNESDLNDPEGYAWDTPSGAVNEELACWSE